MGAIATIDKRIESNPETRAPGNDAPPEPEAIANARLIAAAPDLLATCKWLQVYAEVQVRNHPDATDTPNWRGLLAAIARAEGERGE